MLSRQQVRGNYKSAEKKKNVKAALRSANRRKLAEQVCVTDTVKVSQLAPRTLSKLPSNFRKTNHIGGDRMTPNNKRSICPEHFSFFFFDVQGYSFISWG